MRDTTPEEKRILIKQYEEVILSEETTDEQKGMARLYIKFLKSELKEDE